MSSSAAAHFAHLPRVVIENTYPEINCGRYPVKRLVGDRLEVWADLLIDGHREIKAALNYRPPGKAKWQETPFIFSDNDRWHGHIPLKQSGLYQYRIVAWPKENESAITESPILEAQVEPELARFSAWYEMFPRDLGTFADCQGRLPDIKAMGFDIIYLPPVHPIGYSGRKGRNNALAARPEEPGSPWAIGSEEGGHKSIHPALGTLNDFQRFVEAAAVLGLKVALDFAVQCSLDHPYIKEHPEWFRFRADGTIQHAENPPKKYEDIVNFNFESPAAESLWEELRSIILFWIKQGVTVFRVDNPHTKPFAFWEWLIRSVKQRHPETIFLSEAFTRPKSMHLLAKLGFSQSYSYFTWRTTKQELREYLSELTTWPAYEYFRPNFFPTTPDIFPHHLHEAGRAGFIIRLTLAATLSANYGMLAGYELCEGAPLPDGKGAFKEEYLHSEKYEIRARDWNAPGNIKPFVAALNRIRRENPAFQQLTNLRFYFSSDDQVLFYGKWNDDLSNIVFVVVNLDPHHARESFIDMPLNELGIDEREPYRLDDLLQGHRWEWNGARQSQRLDPAVNPVAIFRISL